jgi:undecaprenyl-diphosphatase
MDVITATAGSIQNPILTAVDLFFDDFFVYAVLIIAITLLAEKRDNKRKKIFLALFVAFVMAVGLKMLLVVERPCFGTENCPSDYSFPSTHATIAFTLMVGFLNKKSFPSFLLLALFVCFTRLNLGVHTFYDIVGALPVALVAYYMTDIFWKELVATESKTKEREDGTRN